METPLQTPRKLPQAVHIAKCSGNPDSALHKGEGEICKNPHHSTKRHMDLRVRDSLLPHTRKPRCLEALSHLPAPSTYLTNGEHTLLMVRTCRSHTQKPDANAYELCDF